MELSEVKAVPYANAYRPGAPYKGEEILNDLKTIFREFKPTKIFLSHPADHNLDHRSLYLFTRVALWEHHIFDQTRALTKDIIKVNRTPTEITISVSMQILGNPQRILTSANTYIGSVPLDWAAWRILELNNEEAIQ